MQILVIEDEDAKFEKFLEAFQERGITNDTINRVDNLVDLLSLGENLSRYDLCLIDFFLPVRKGEKDVQNCVDDILKVLDNSNLSSVPVMAITRHVAEPDFDDHKVKSKGILAYDFEQEDIWKVAVDSFLARAKDRHKYDFIGILALEEERLGFMRVPNIDVESRKVVGLDAWEVKIGDWRGALFCLPKMGLVDAAVATSKIMSNYSPKVAFMSGICGGSEKTKMGQLLVTDFCWEYQSGKWIAEGFQSDPYQEGISEPLKADLSILLKSRTNLVKDLEDDLHDLERPSKLAKPTMAIFASGSAVVASKEQMKKIKSQHRKVKGIDMEIFAFHRAMNLCEDRIPHFSCKVVVDKADEQKDDELHDYGCALSALAAVEFMGEILADQS
ncbi:hypothetical protein [uncultured Ruegeria sp.]|uniref:5'-methylthioadenosine/S-adenosylhomocysteine nucleosidase family protein n=1 Tax=uncultured Ruegeria sp. TaxID=259304 RepID=UPI002635A36C|nr:hypothetical protein [uncultured Ruegeria sp.]